MSNPTIGSAEPDARPVALVTGANGFIGTNVCRGLVKSGYRVYAMVRESSDLRMLDGVPVEFLKADLRFPKQVRLPADVEYVVHGAALVSDTAGAADCRAGILGATANLASAAVRDCPRLQRFVYLSTALVLGYGREGVSESRPGRPVDYLPYVRYKRKAERFLLDRHRQTGFPLVILRPADVYGPFDRTSILPMCEGISRGVPLIVGRTPRAMAYCYVGNMVQAVLRALVADGVEGRSYTVTNRTRVTFHRFFSTLAAGLGRRQRTAVPVAAAFLVAAAFDALYRFLPLPDPPVTFYRVRRACTDTTYDISATVRDLGFEPDEDVERQLGEAVDWYRRTAGAAG